MTGFHRFHAQGDGQVGFTHSRWPQQNDVLAAFHKRQACQSLDQFTVQARLECEIELRQGLHPGQARLPEPAVHPVHMASLPFDPQGFSQKRRVIPFLFGRLLTHRLPLCRQVLEFQPRQ